jgi:hypothetical protein
MTPSLPPAGYEYGEARRRYVEHGLDPGHEHVSATRRGVSVDRHRGLVGLNVHTQRALGHVKPLVIRIDDVGIGRRQLRQPDLHAAGASSSFLVQFVTMHYGRMRATVRQQVRPVALLSRRPPRDATIDANKKSGLIERFLTSGSEEVDVRVKNVTLEDLRQPPYRATVDFDKVYLAPVTRTELKREAFVAHLVFVVTEQVDNARIPINPLGLTITYFREDQAFVNGQ